LTIVFGLFLAAGFVAVVVFDEVTLSVVEK
jgi:hypothetical protein